MTIGIWTDKIDSFYTTVYSIKINLPFHNKKDKIKLNIIEVQSDQRTLCRPKKLEKENKYRCLFMVFYTGINAINHLLLYPEIQEYSPYKMYAKFITARRYLFYDYTYLNSEIPKEDDEYSTEINKQEYLFIPHPDRFDQYLYVNIISESEK